PYSGCEYGCVFCHGLKEDVADTGDPVSPWRVSIKTSCVFSLNRDLAAFESDSALPKEKRRSTGIGFGSDPYQPCEAEYRLTQRSLEIFRDKSLPVHIITKSDLVLRDAGILSELSREGLCVVSVSLFTLKEELARIFEPRVLPPKKRLDLIAKLRRAGIVAGAAVMPIFPHLTDSPGELDALYSRLKSHGALYSMPGILSLDRPGARARVERVLRERFPALWKNFEGIYGKEGYPSQEYCGRVLETLKQVSRRREIPTVLPLESARLAVTAELRSSP
ncbi:MAG: hypothetical protein A2902_04905, partial [Elusimicrobia bacterium RIFCSPLOWO2_01_FULL_64_13]